MNDTIATFLGLGAAALAVLAFAVGRAVGRAEARRVFETHAIAEADATWRRRTGRPNLDKIKDPAGPP